MKSNTLGKETQENNNTHDNASHKAQCIMQGNTTRKTKQHTRGKEARKTKQHTRGEEAGKTKQHIVTLIKDAKKGVV